MIISREVHLAKRPNGTPGPECFKIVDTQLPEIGDNQVLIKNSWLSVDPYMRGRMDDRESYVPPFQLNEVMSGGAVGEVIASNHPDYRVGESVQHMLGWREYSIVDPSTPPGLKRCNSDLLPPQAYLGIAGMPGMTSYSGIVFVAEAKAGETVFVSGAAGAVGSLACQIAKILGCTVVASAGSDEKVAWLKNTLGVDEAFNYKTVSSISEALAECCPQGIDVYFENVGGAHLDAAADHMNTFGRMAVCGLISDYNEVQDTNSHSIFLRLLTKSINVRFFIVSQFYDHQDEYHQALAEWVKDGKIIREETVYEGIEQAPDAFLGLFSGHNRGKMLVKLA